jgi:hypothetical protein
MMMSRLNNAIRCEALFLSDLQASQHPDRREVRAAIRRTVRSSGADGCAAQVAQEFGDHPETAVSRMRWARETVSLAYSPVNRASSSRLPAAAAG